MNLNVQKDVREAIEDAYKQWICFSVHDLNQTDENVQESWDAVLEVLESVR
jgi:hypothetical protein